MVQAEVLSIATVSRSCSGSNVLWNLVSSLELSDVRELERRSRPDHTGTPLD